MIRSEILKHFILGFGLAIPDNDLGRPTNITQLEVAARETCGNCHGELFDALYNLHTTHAELRKYVAVEGGFQSPVSFERVRNTQPLPKHKNKSLKDALLSSLTLVEGLSSR